LSYLDDLNSIGGKTKTLVDCYKRDLRDYCNKTKEN